MAHPGNDERLGGPADVQEASTTFISKQQWQEWIALESHQNKTEKFVFCFLFRGGCPWQQVKDFATVYLAERVQGVILGAGLPEEFVQIGTIRVFPVADHSYICKVPASVHADYEDRVRDYLKQHVGPAGELNLGTIFVKDGGRYPPPAQQGVGANPPGIIALLEGWRPAIYIIEDLPQLPEAARGEFLTAAYKMMSGSGITEARSIDRAGSKMRVQMAPGELPLPALQPYDIEEGKRGRLKATRQGQVNYKGTPLPAPPPIPKADQPGGTYVPPPPPAVTEMERQQQQQQRQATQAAAAQAAGTTAPAGVTGPSPHAAAPQPAQPAAAATYATRAGTSRAGTGPAGNRAAAQAAAPGPEGRGEATAAAKPTEAPGPPQTRATRRAAAQAGAEAAQTAAPGTAAGRDTAPRATEQAPPERAAAGDGRGLALRIPTVPSRQGEHAAFFEAADITTGPQNPLKLPPPGTQEYEEHMARVTDAARRAAQYAHAAKQQLRERAQRARESTAELRQQLAGQPGDQGPKPGSRARTESSSGDTPRAKAATREQPAAGESMALEEEGWERGKHPAPATSDPPQALVTMNRFGSLREEDPGEDSGGAK